MSSNQFIAKCFYSSIIIITLLFTIISMLTPGWRIIIKGNQIGEYDQSKIINSGIFICDTEGMADCMAKRSTVDTLIGVLLILVILFELIALGWSIAALVFDEKEGITNQKRILFTPLPIFSFIICILFLFVILLFLLKQNGQIEFDINMSVAKGATIGYSFIICCFGFIFAICSILPGLFLTLLKENIT
ncbi:hypothetical protein Mgra_00001800 [Meloidogyne graminicola]|uniref:Uncharacterized protein n=1 Tax=Meloidogyne graminicola TaxID=189291 RepID=A0A8S9ZZL2_9BILA|nr:hypothetical protein Mgra_00001800 [Meloidogyne graminicola]